MLPASRRFNQGLKLLLAFLADLEIPVHLGLSHEAPTQSLTQAWAVGTMLQKITVYAVSDAVYEAWKGEKVPYLSLAGKLAAAVFVPPFAMATFRFAAAGRLVAMEDGQLWLRLSYLIATAVSIAYLSVTQTFRAMSSWTDVLKDELFLEQTELLNYEDEGKTREPKPQLGNGAIGALPDHILQEQPRPAEAM